MNNLFPLLGAAVFALVLLFDILLRRHKKIRRGFADGIFLCLLAVGLTVSAVRGLGGLMEENAGVRPGMYLAYRYLESGDVEKARAAAENDGSLSREQRGLLEVLLSAAEGNYPALYFAAEELLEEGISSAEQQDCVEELHSFSKAYLRQDASAAEFVSVSGEAERGMQVPEKISSLIRQCFETENIQETEELNDYYYLDSQVRGGGAEAVDPSDVENLCQKYPFSQDILKLAVKFYAEREEYGEAQGKAKRLLELEDSAENYVIYTDVIAQRAYAGDVQSGGDAEKEGLIQEAERLEEQAARYGDEDERRERLLNEAEARREEASHVDIYRAINFLEAKKPMFRDRSGLYDTQIAKLYLAAGDREAAKKRVHAILEHVDALSEDSPVREALMDVADAYRQTSSESESPVLKSAVREFVETQSQGIIQVQDGTINGRMADFVASVLKYDKLGIFISRVDTSGYPEITACLNMNGEREGRWGMSGEFYADDFEIIDTQYKIEDFELNADASKTGVDIALVMDCSGNMSEEALEDAEKAAQACAEDMDTGRQQMAVVTYSDEARTLVSRTNDPESLIYGIHQSSRGGGTNISAGLQEGLDALAGGRGGTKALILMAGGQDGNEEAIDETVSRAVSEQTAVYVVGLGDAREESLRDIADRTGGKFIMADSSAELEDICLTLQKYIVNSYVLTYTVSENAEADSRYLMVSVPDSQISARRDYAVSGGGEESADTDEKGIRPSGEEDAQLLSVSPGAVSAEEAASGLTVTVKGTGFQEGMHVNVGELELSEVAVQDENTLTGILKGNLSTGACRVSAQYPDGRVGVREDGLRVFRAGTSTGVRIGGTVIRADRIGQTAEGVFSAAGNVLINDFIHFSGSLEIRALDLPEKFTLNSGRITYLGDRGKISGSGKLYISYPRAEDEDPNYAGLALEGRDYVVQEGQVDFTVQGMETELGENLTLRLPLLVDVTASSAVLDTDGIKIRGREAKFSDMADSMPEGTDHSVTSRKEKTAVDAVGRGAAASGAEKSAEASVWTADPRAGLEILIRQDNISAEGELSLEEGGALNLGRIGLSAAKLKLDTLDEEQEYWKLEGTLDFSAFPELEAAAAQEKRAVISSRYWRLDKVEADVELDPEIPLYQGLYLNGLSLEEETDSSSAPEEQQDFWLTGAAEGNVDLFEGLNMQVSENMTDWGRLGAFQGTATLHCGEPSLQIETGLELLGNELPDVSLDLGTFGFSADARSQLELEMLGMDLGGEAALHLESSREQMDMRLELDGYLNCSMLNLNCQGDMVLEAGVRFDGTLFSVGITENGREHRLWYQDNGELFLTDKIYCS